MIRAGAILPFAVCGYLLALVSLLALLWLITAYAPRMSETQQPQPEPDEEREQREREAERDPVEREREQREQQDDDQPQPPPARR